MNARFKNFQKASRRRSNSFLPSRIRDGKKSNFPRIQSWTTNEHIWTRFSRDSTHHELPHKNLLTSRVLKLRDQGHHSYFIKISEENERIFPPIARRNPPRLRSPTTENWIEISSWRGLPVPRKKGWVAVVTSPVFCPLHPSATLHPFDIAFPELSWKPLPSSTLSLSLSYYISLPSPLSFARVFHYTRKIGSLDDVAPCWTGWKKVEGEVEGGKG